MEFTITLVLIIGTSIVSLSAFNNEKIINDLIFYPPSVSRGQWYRFFSCGLIHANYFHLIFNMYALYSFGSNVETGIEYSNTVEKANGFLQIFGETKGKILYLLMYALALGFCLVPTFIKHKNDYYYRSLGASGAVSAVIFAGMLLEPRSGVGLIFIPNVNIPGYVFAPVFLIVSHYLARRGKDNINHSAHIWGAIFGIVFVIVMALLIADYNPIESFIRSIRMDTGI